MDESDEKLTTKDDLTDQERVTKQVSESIVPKYIVKYILIALAGFLLMVPLQSNVRSQVPAQVEELGYPTSEIEDIIYNGSKAEVIFKIYSPLDNMKFKKSLTGWKLEEKVYRK